MSENIIDHIFGEYFRTGSFGWAEFRTIADRLAQQADLDLIELQSQLIDALLATSSALPPQPEESFEEGLESIRNTLVRDDTDDADDPDNWGSSGDLIDGLYEIADMQEAHGEPKTRKWILQAVRDPGAEGWGDLGCLLRTVPRAYRLRTGQMFPGCAPWDAEEYFDSLGETWPYTVESEYVDADRETWWVVSCFLCPSELLACYLPDMDKFFARSLGMKLTNRTATRQAIEWDENDFRPADGSIVADLQGRVAEAALLARPPAGERTAPWRDITNLPKAPPKMREVTFWRLIENLSGEVTEESLERLREAMTARKSGERTAFSHLGRTLRDSLDRPELFQAAETSLGFVSEDVWRDVRSAVIAGGADAFAQARDNPATFDWLDLYLDEAESLSDLFDELAEPDVESVETLRDKGSERLRGYGIASVRIDPDDRPMLTIRYWTNGIRDISEVLASHDSAERGRAQNAQATYEGVVGTFTIDDRDRDVAAFVLTDHYYVMSASMDSDTPTDLANRVR